MTNVAEERLLGPGQRWDGVDVVDDPAFQLPKPARTPPPSKREQLFNRAVYAAEMAHRQGLPVTAEALAQETPDIPVALWQDLLASGRVRAALEARGIPLMHESGLSPQQMSAAAIYLDTSSTLTRAQRLRAAGVTAAQWNGWMRQPVFAQYISQVSESILTDVVPLALQKIHEKVDAGERWAIELSLEMTKRHDRRERGVDPMQLLVTVFSALDDAGVDQQLMARIAARLKPLLGGEPPQLVPSHAIITAGASAPAMPGAPTEPPLEA